MFSTVGSNAASFTAFNALPTPEGDQHGAQTRHRRTRL